MKVPPGIAAPIVIIAVVTIVGFARVYDYSGDRGYVLGNVVGSALGAAILLVIYWAFRRFRREQAKIVLGAWAAVFVLINVFQMRADLEQDGRALAGAFQDGRLAGKVRDDFLRSGNASCIRKWKQEQPDIDGDTVTAYCGCAMTRMADLVTPGQFKSLDRGAMPEDLRGQLEPYAAECWRSVQKAPVK